MTMRSALAFLLLLPLLLSGSADAQDLHKVAESVDRRYNGLRSLQTEFTETYRGPGVVRTESGTLWLKKPGRMRWDYREPQEKLFVTDGKKAYFYVPGEHQAREAPIKNLDDLRSPLRYLLGKTKLEKEFSGLSLANVPPLEPGNVVLQGVPKSMADRLSRVLLEVGPEGRLFRIVAEELDGSSTEFRFRNQRENVAIPDSRFLFHPPPGVETIQAEDVGEY